MLMGGESLHRDTRHVRGGRSAHRLARVAVLATLLLTTSLSGCISLDFFLPQKAAPEEVSQGNGLVRLWVAVQPGAIGAEFLRYNLTFGTSGHVRDLFGTDIVPMNSTTPTVDLVLLERARKSVPIAGLIVRPGTYYGYTFQVTNASLTRSEVIGNDNGEEIIRFSDEPVKPNTTPALVDIAHQVFADSVTDIFIEIDMRRSLTEEKGTYHHATVLTGTSIYVNGHKAAEERAPQRVNDDPLKPSVDPYGARWNDLTKFSPPTARYEVIDEHQGGKLYDSLKPNKHYTKVIGLGQDLRFTSRSYSNIFDQGVPANVTEILWNFADGTTAVGGSAWHNWTSGGIYDVSLSVRDEYDLVGRTHGTFIVPYRPDEAVRVQSDARADTLLVGSPNLPDDSTLGTASQQFTFPQDLENGDLRLGAYRTTLRFTDPTGGLAGAGTIMKMGLDSGHLQTKVNGTSPLVVESAGLATWWPGPTPWVDDTISIDLELLTGAYVSYELTVEALYFENMTRGYDSHPAHRHGPWPFGPDIRTVSWDGTAAPPQDDE